MNTIQILSSQPWVERLGWTLIHFLWQGALIAAAYAVARRQGTPQFRYLLACAALAAMTIAPTMTFGLMAASESAANNPFTGTVPLSSAAASTTLAAPVALPFTAAHNWPDAAMPWLVITWFAGAIIFWMRLTGGWIIATRMRSKLTRHAPAEWQQTLDRIKTRIQISRPVRLLVSAIVQVPTVVGWLRPVVLVPIGVLTGLPPEQIEAVLAHELAHVRRHDYLVNILQSVGEALLFYHPAVWWVSNQIRHERELCCDDIAVAISGDALNYARALADLEAQRPVHFNPALAANGGSLPERIGRLLGIRAPSRPVSGPAAIAAAGLILITAFATFAQPTSPKPPRPVFEVASIKPSPPDYVGFQSYVKGDRYTAMAATIRNLVGFAYGIRDFQISGGPGWSATAAYNIDAKMDAAAPPNQVRQMMQSLLADRFNLQFHRVTQNRAGYALMIDSNGSKLVESKNPGPGLASGFKDRMIARGTNMELLAQAFSSRLESPVTDRTELNAIYDFTLTWTPDEAAADSLGPSMFTALREQLGLRLEPAKNIPVDTLVIDHVDKPSEN
jgi:uncharacterized protein (TIGR03435 family)